MEIRSISVTETAKLIRKQLKKHFPDTKFSVKCKKYAGGASIDVWWTADWPTVREVKSITDLYVGSNFDSMDDPTTYVNQYMYKDGSITKTIAHEGQKKELVHFEANHIFCHRQSPQGGPTNV